MGYSTDFDGHFAITPALTESQREYLLAFAETRRMKRDEMFAGLLPDPKRIAVNLPVGEDGAYFVGGTGLGGEAIDESVVRHNSPPHGQPGLWCQWIPGDDGATLAWDGSEKFHKYTEWLEYLVQNFLVPWCRTINGQVQWTGEDNEDIGTIYADANRVEAVPATIVYGKPKWDIT